MSKVTSLEKAISVIKSGDNIGINSFFTIANPINLLEKLNERIQHKHDLKDLSVYMTAPMATGTKTSRRKDFSRPTLSKR